MDIYEAAHRIFHGKNVAIQLVGERVPIVFTSSLEPFAKDSQGRNIKKPVNKADIQEIVTTMVAALSPRCVSSRFWYVRDSNAFRSNGEL